MFPYGGGLEGCGRHNGGGTDHADLRMEVYKQQISRGSVESPLVCFTTEVAGHISLVLDTIKSTEQTGLDQQIKSAGEKLK